MARTHVLDILLLRPQLKRRNESSCPEVRIELLRTVICALARVADSNGVRSCDLRRCWTTSFAWVIRLVEVRHLPFVISFLIII